MPHYGLGVADTGPPPASLLPYLPPHYCPLSCMHNRCRDEVDEKSPFGFLHDSTIRRLDSVLFRPLGWTQKLAGQIDVTPI